MRRAPAVSHCSPRAIPRRATFAFVGKSRLEGSDSVFAEEDRVARSGIGGDRVAERTILFKAALDLHLLTRERIRRHG